MIQFIAPVTSNIRVARGYMRLTFAWPQDLPDPAPGQFVTIRNAETTDPLLRRPFAISSFDHGACSIVYQIRGKGTQSMAARTFGESMDILGPLGNSFPTPDTGQRAILVAGGVGFGPMYYLASRLAASGARPFTIVGARSADLIPNVDYTGDFSFCTDDGSRGFHGTVTDFLGSRHDLDFAACRLYACGPDPMLAACSRFAQGVGMKCWVSVEQVMGCGVGACMGCAIRVKGEKRYARVCTEGPVFDGNDIEW